MDNSLYNLKIVTSGKRLEVYKISRYAVKTQGESHNKNGRNGKKELLQDQKEENKKVRRKSTLTSTRNNIIRLISANEDMNTFITLTFREEVDYKNSKKLLSKMFKKLNKHYINLKYLWVLEFGSKNNRLHYHVLTNIQLDKNIQFAATKELKSEDHKEYENKFSSTYWPHGFVDIRNLTQEGNNNIALYISCYIVKDMLEIQLHGYRIYGYSSKTLDKPTVSKVYDTRQLEEIIKDFSKDYKIKYVNSYEVGYTDYRGDHKGTTTYIDLIRKN